MLPSQSPSQWWWGDKRERRETRKQIKNTRNRPHTNNQASEMAEAIILYAIPVYTRAMYKKGLSFSVLVLEPEFSGEERVQDSPQKVRCKHCLLLPSREKLYTPPPLPPFLVKTHFQGRGVGVYILRGYAAGILYAPPLLYTPHP